MAKRVYKYTQPSTAARAARVVGRDRNRSLSSYQQPKACYRRVFALIQYHCANENGIKRFRFQEPRPPRFFLFKTSIFFFSTRTTYIYILYSCTIHITLRIKHVADYAQNAPRFVLAARGANTRTRLHVKYDRGAHVRITWAYRLCFTSFFRTRCLSRHCTCVPGRWRSLFLLLLLLLRRRSVYSRTTI